MGDYTAFIEGWAVFAESMFQSSSTVAEAIGTCESELFRACRLVMDTGIHGLHWSFDQAYEYLARYSTETPEELRQEVLRCVCDPGQMCAYPVGLAIFRDIVASRRSKSSCGTASCEDDPQVTALLAQVLREGAVPMHILLQRHFGRGKR